MTKNYGKNMLLHTSYWGNADTFKLMPITMDCPFTEVIYDPGTTLLVVISKIKKENFQYVPKLDDDGETMKAKKPKQNGKAIREQRVLMPVLQEYYITDPVEQEAFIKQFAVNPEYDYSRFLRDMDSEPTIVPAEKAPLVDAKGMPLKKAKLAKKATLPKK